MYITINGIMYTLVLFKLIVFQLYSKKETITVKSNESPETLIEFVGLVFHFLECLYDPYFIWRKRLKG